MRSRYWRTRSSTVRCCSATKRNPARSTSTTEESSTRNLAERQAKQRFGGSAKLRVVVLNFKNQPANFPPASPHSATLTSSSTRCASSTKKNNSRLKALVLFFEIMYTLSAQFSDPPGPILLLTHSGGLVLPSS